MARLSIEGKTRNNWRYTRYYYYCTIHNNIRFLFFHFLFSRGLSCKNNNGKKNSQSARVSFIFFLPFFSYRVHQWSHRARLYILTQVRAPRNHLRLVTTADELFLLFEFYFGNGWTEKWFCCCPFHLFSGLSKLSANPFASCDLNVLVSPFSCSYESGDCCSFGRTTTTEEKKKKEKNLILGGKREKRGPIISRDWLSFTCCLRSRQTSIPDISVPGRSRGPSLTV
jgi:hypothetical protein